ncbi:MAG: SLATT domain-containing protein [Chlorobiaceae bacterium]|nr:SLATT domain-containing protein [Chlorobiaceae bacterium]
MTIIENMEKNINLKELITQEAGRVEEDCIFSAKGHMNAAATWRRVNYYLGIPATCLTALAGASAANMIVDSEYAPMIACLSTIITALLTFIKPEEKADLHSKSGGSLNSLKNNIRIFRDIEVFQSEDTEFLANKLHLLSDERNKLNKESLSIPYFAYRKAKKGIEMGESSYKIDLNK